MIGIGASAIQFIPQVAKEAGSLTIYQRSANYVGPKADEPIPDRALVARRGHSGPGVGPLRREKLQRPSTASRTW